MTIEELALKRGVTKGSLQRSKSKIGAMEISEAKRPRGPQAGNAKLKKLLTETMLEKTAIEAPLQ